MSNDAVLRYMTDHNLPMTREAYLELAFMGDVPDEIDAETEFSLPEMFQQDPQIDEEEFE